MIDNGLEESAKLEMVNIKEEIQEIYKEGMMWGKDDGPPPEGFTVYTMESGVSVLRRKRQRNLQKLGIGGFLVRVRGIKAGQDNDEVDMLPGQNAVVPETPPPIVSEPDKPRRKPIRRKPRSKLAESFPPYLQEAFFGKELLDSHKEANSSSSDEEGSKTGGDKDKTIQLSQVLAVSYLFFNSGIEWNNFSKVILHYCCKVRWCSLTVFVFRMN